MIYIETPRLILRSWKDEDILPFAKLNSDPNVMKYFLKPLTYEESVEFMQSIKDEIALYGYGTYAIEEKASGAFVGLTGFHNIAFEADFVPGIEIGWRILPEYWNRGYVTEAAKACLAYAKSDLHLTEVLAFTSLPNKSSERVMQKIGMKKVKNFNHPLVPVEHPLLEHVLYQVHFWCF